VPFHCSLSGDADAARRRFACRHIGAERTGPELASAILAFLGDGI
jgi:hypothetical protein